MESTRTLGLFVFVYWLANYRLNKIKDNFPIFTGKRQFDNVKKKNICHSTIWHFQTSHPTSTPSKYNNFSTFLSLHLHLDFPFILIESLIIFRWQQKKQKENKQTNKRWKILSSTFYKLFIYDKAFIGRTFINLLYNWKSFFISVFFREKEKPLSRKW